MAAIGFFILDSRSLPHAALEVTRFTNIILSLANVRPGKHH
jgi:hypothetical protein